MKLLDRYIIRKFLGTIFFMVLILIIVTVVIDYAEKIDDFREKKAPWQSIIFQYYANFIPFIVNLLSPICVFLAVILFTSKMTQDSEIVAILSSGISLYRLLMPYLFSAVCMTGINFYLTNFIVPKAQVKRMDFEYAFVKNYRPFDERNIHKKIASNQFVYMSAFNQYENVAYEFSLEYIEKGKLKSRLKCDKAVYREASQEWNLQNVWIRNFKDSGEELLFLGEKDTSILLKPEDVFKKENFVSSLTLPELNEYIDLERMRGSDFLKDLETNRHERYAFPFASIILTMIGLALSTKKRRGGIALQLGIGIVISFAYIILLQTGRLMAGEQIPGWLAVWLPNFVFFILGILLLRWAPK